MPKVIAWQLRYVILQPHLCSKHSISIANHCKGPLWLFLKQNIKSVFLTYSNGSNMVLYVLESLQYIPWTGSCHLWRWWRGRQWGVNSTSTFKSGGQRILASLSIVRRGHRVGDSRCRFDRRTGGCWVTFRIHSQNYTWIIITVNWDDFR